MLRKKIGLLFLITLVGIGLVASPALGKVTLRFWEQQDFPELSEPIQASCDEFEALNPGVKIEWTGIEMGDLETRMATIVAAHNEPDVSMMGGGAWMFLMKEKMLVPLDDVIERLGKTNYSSASLKQMAYEGTIWGVPGNVWMANLIYRRDWLQEAGFDYNMIPRSAEAFLEAVKKITNAEADRYGFVFSMGPGMEELNLYPWEASHGASWLDPYTGEPSFNTSANIAALKFMKELYPYCPPGQVGYGWDEEVNAFLTGKAWAVTTCCPEALDAAYDRGLEWADDIYSIAPPGPVFSAPIWFNPYAVFATSEYPDIAKDFLAYYCSAKPFARKISFTPATYPTAYMPTNEQEILVENLLKKYPQVYEQALAVLPYATVPGNPAGPAPWTAVLDAPVLRKELYADVFLRNVPVEEAVAKFNQVYVEAYEAREK